ncbi:hypothetical protein M8C21_000955, partial [Ambrosia artemisiifolia]
TLIGLITGPLRPLGPNANKQVIVTWVVLQFLYIISLSPCRRISPPLVVMSQVDNRNSSSSVKRARTDGGRREDDWTCPSCGNKSAPRQMPTPQGGYSSAYSGSAAPASMYVGVPPYGASLLNGTSMPSYDAPLSGGSAYNYIYNNRLAGGSPYRPLQLSGTPPYSGGIYGLPQLMEQFGLRLPMGQTALGPRPGFYSEETSQKKDGSRENDWECPQCGNVNFAFRTVCNMRKCNTPKPGSQAAQLSKSSMSWSAVAQFGSKVSHVSVFVLLLVIKLLWFVIRVVKLWSVIFRFLCRLGKCSRFIEWVLCH